MARNAEHRAELDALAVRLASPRRARTASPDPEREAATPAQEFDTLLRDLESKLTAVAEDAEHIVLAHPLATLGAAFLLGLVIGRMVGGRR